MCSPHYASSLFRLRRLVVQPGGGAEAALSAYAGEVRAREESPLSFRVGGNLVRRNVDAGARVQKGEVLALLDSGDFALQAGHFFGKPKLLRAHIHLHKEAQARAAGFIPVSLGARVLRAETAAIAGTALWMGTRGDWG